jgi:type II secretory ATPase GspE/PulE/Tfp pilus assembly ATPase PilB-like protein
MAKIENLRDYGWRKVLSGVTSAEEVVRVTQEDEIADSIQ